MTTKTITWGAFRYIAFLLLFVSLFTVYWAYSFEAHTNPDGLQEKLYPYRNYSVLFVAVSIVLFAVYLYSGIKDKNKITGTPCFLMDNHFISSPT